MNHTAQDWIDFLTDEHDLDSDEAINASDLAGEWVTCAVGAVTPALAERLAEKGRLICDAIQALPIEDRDWRGYTDELRRQATTTDGERFIFDLGMDFAKSVNDGAWETAIHVLRNIQEIARAHKVT